MTGGRGSLPKNWQDFFRVNSNKTELFNFLTKSLLVTFSQDGKQFVSTDGESILSNTPLHNPDSLSSCIHEEADTRLLLHANHATLCGHLKIGQ